MVEEMVTAQWRIRRLMAIETALIDLEMIRPELALETKTTRFDVGIQLAPPLPPWLTSRDTIVAPDAL